MRVKIWRTIKTFLKSAFSPKARYEAAAWGNGWKSWLPGGLVDARIDISKATREELMRKARYFEKNSAIARRIGSVWCDFTVGASGMVFTPASSDPAWNENARAYLSKSLDVIDLSTRQTFGSLQQLIAWRDLFDGDCFIVKTRGQDNQGRWWPRIEIIEAHLCSTPDTRKADEGKTIIDGVEVDANGRPTGYWFRTASDAQTFRLVEAKNVIVCIDPDRAKQTRGISGFAAALNYLHRLDDLQDLEFRAITDAAEKSTFIKTATGQMPPGMTNGGMPGDGFGLGTPATGTPTNPNAVTEAIGGRTVALQLGEDVEQFTPTRPTESTRALWSYLTSCCCAAVGIPKMLCFSEWLEGAQGTIVRGDYDIAAQMFRARSGIYAAAFREVILYVLTWGIATEKNLASPPGDWTNITTTSPRSANVDVGRNSAAQQSEVKLGLTTHEAIYAALGKDARQEITSQIRFIAFVKKTCAEISASEGVEVTAAEVLGEIITGGQPQPFGTAPAAQPAPDSEFA